MKNIALRIRRDGTVEAETHGLKGRECLVYIAELERLLEAETVDSAYTAEFHEEAEVGQQAEGMQRDQLYGEL